MNPCTSAEVRIKQICCMRLPSETLIPAVLKELHTVVPSCGRTFFWCDENYQLSNLYDDPFTDPSIAELYLQEFYDRPERTCTPRFTYIMQHYNGAIRYRQLLKVDWRTYLRSDFYNLLMRPVGYADGLHLVVRDGSRAMGYLAVWRALNEPPFAGCNKPRLENLAPFIAHALAGFEQEKGEGGSRPLLVDKDEDHGLIVVNRSGEIQHFSPQARKLLFLATHPQVAFKTTQSKDAWLPSQVVDMCKNLTAVFEGRQGVVAPPTYRHRNCWGEFVFRAYWLNSANPLNSLIGISMERQIPLLTVIVGRMEQFSLSQRQMQICLLLAAGHTDPEIAHQLNMSANTVITHNRRIYDKLAVHNRGELIDKLLKR